MTLWNEYSDHQSIWEEDLDSLSDSDIIEHVDYYIGKDKKKRNEIKKNLDGKPKHMVTLLCKNCVGILMIQETYPALRILSICFLIEQ